MLFAYGMLIDKTSAANFVPVNEADDWLHLALGLLMVGLGVGLASRATSERRRVAALADPDFRPPRPLPVDPPVVAADRDPRRPPG